MISFVFGGDVTAQEEEIPAAKDLNRRQFLREVRQSLQKEIVSIETKPKMSPWDFLKPLPPSSFDISCKSFLMNSKLKCDSPLPELVRLTETSKTSSQGKNSNFGCRKYPM
jgi:hypothetical protein